MTDPLSAPDGTIVTPDYGLGVVGALIGALLGGAVFAIVISVLTVLAANYALYAWQFAQTYEGRYTFVECLGQLPGWLKTNSEVLAGFVKDICIVYAFTLLAGFSAVKNMFGKKIKK